MGELYIKKRNRSQPKRDIREMGRKDFQVVVMHGHSNDYLEIKAIILECGFIPRIMIEEYSADTIFENMRNLIWEDIHCVIVLMSKDDSMKNDLKRARQNVVFEMGYCFGAFDSLPDRASYKPKHALIIIAEKGVETFSDIHGLTIIEYETNSLGKEKERIIDSLNQSYKKAKAYYYL